MQEIEKNKVIFQTLHEVFGLDAFRYAQREIIDAVLSGEDAVVLLPTGGGKSLCYQLPAIILPGTCLVVSPLLALMKDQVIALKNKGIEAAYLSSELDEQKQEEIYRRCIEGITKILYLSPERLSNSNFIRKIQEIQVSFIAVDEAHCISEWGQDFRPNYQKIKDFRKSFLQDISCLALTATATPKVFEDILEKLALKSPKVFRNSYKRENIKIFSQELGDKYQQVFDFLSLNKTSGIIYVRTRKEAEELTHFLRNKGLDYVDFYHAGLETKDKNDKQKRWQQSNSRVLISTNAFGMGVDKDNVRFVIHFSPPYSLENYYQEIGRAGRDGKTSYAFVLWNEQEMSDVDRILSDQIPNKSEYQKIISYVYSHFQIGENELSDRTFELQLQKIQDFTKYSYQKIKNVLGFLHNQEIIYFNPSKKRSSLELKFSVSDLDLLQKKDAYLIEMLLRNISGLTSGKVLFNENNLSEKMGGNAADLKARLKELRKKDLVEYINGAENTIKFLQPREDRKLLGKYWSVFEGIQQNKLQKWEELKFFIRDRSFCKMKLILSYFGEKDAEDCNNCYVCDSKTKVDVNHLHQLVLEQLKEKPMTMDQISIQLKTYPKDELLDNLKFLLDLGKIKMLDYKTYIIKQ